MSDTDRKPPGFGIVGLALSGFVLAGPGAYLINTGHPFFGWPLVVVGGLPLIWDAVTMQPGLYWRIVIVGLTAVVAASLCGRMAS